MKNTYQLIKSVEELVLEFKERSNLMASQADSGRSQRSAMERAMTERRILADFNDLLGASQKLLDDRKAALDTGLTAVKNKLGLDNIKMAGIGTFTSAKREVITVEDWEKVDALETQVGVKLRQNRISKDVFLAAQLEAGWDDVQSGVNKKTVVGPSFRRT